MISVFYQKIFISYSVITTNADSSWYETKKALHFMPHLEYIFVVGVCGGVLVKVDLGNIINHLWIQ